VNRRTQKFTDDCLWETSAVIFSVVITQETAVIACCQTNGIFSWFLHYLYINGFENSGQDRPVPKQSSDKKSEAEKKPRLVTLPQPWHFGASSITAAKRYKHIYLYALAMKPS